ncbi:ATP-dependent zinc metalloprotease FtsH [Luteolibacter sp. LG18]|uniref:ATP-dependent zinc metalloprotease FtsH n=1 Tax=Luteolibacter sp. LG18 TaxID=2819286 RepID=UPI002B2CAC72|nr:ATP-dependent zinc metalloprotease FtsH [Luteolibacter sp. LG18]
MSDPQNSRPPQGPNRPGEPTGFNWKLLIFLTVALLILGVAFLNPNLGGSSRTIAYPEFREAWDQGRVILNDQKKYPFKIVTKESYANALITGWMQPKLVRPEKAQTEDYAFKVLANQTVDEGDLKLLKSDHVPMRRVTGDVPAQAEDPATRVLSFAEFRKAFSLGEIAPNDPNGPLTLTTATVGGNAALTGIRKEVKNWEIAKIDGKVQEPRQFEVNTLVALLGDDLSELVKSYGTYETDPDILKSAIFTFLPVLLVVLLLVFLFRQQMKAAGRGAMSFGKSKARLLTMDRNKVTFKDVAGIQEAKEELWEIVDFLRDPRKFQKLGGSIPKGVLMVGPPGTGKTLLARAIAGEADVPFFSISGSDFVEMFVGVGASRVRDMFEQGKKHAPCLIFIDEIDAVGRHRGHGMGGGHDEREQTLNQLLVEMDGFDTQEGVIIIAATNRPDVLDPALLRPGRFDRQVTVSLPDYKGREEILKVHIKKIKLAANTDLGVIARGTPGFSGAELANLINEAALLAARKGMSAVTLAEMEEARDKVRWGRERRSLALSDKEKENTAYHEAGHAILNEILEHTDPLHKVTIIPRGPSLGSTMFLPTEDKFTYRKAELLDQLVVAMGGRVAEEIVFGNVTNGAVGDIRMATHIARKMVCEWGMSDKLGMVEYGEAEGDSFMSRGRSSYSGATAKLIDDEVKGLIDHAYDDAKRLLVDRRTTLELIAQALLEYETLDAEHIKDLIESGSMKNPPSSPKPPSIPDEYRKKEAPKRPDGSSTDEDGPLPGAVVGAPA